MSSAFDTFNQNMTALGDQVRTLGETTGTKTIPQMTTLVSNANEEISDQATLIESIRTALVNKGSGITPSGNINITSMESTNVTNYATATVVDADLVAGNIKKDVNILGVTGTFEGGITPSGTLDITENGTHDVANYASVNVNVRGGGSSGHHVTFSCPFGPYYPDMGNYVIVFSDLSSQYYNNSSIPASLDNVLCVSAIAGSAKVLIGNLNIDYVRLAACSFFLLSDDVSIEFEASCLTGDTLITLADHSTKRIDELTINDKVLSFNPETLQLEEDEITYTDASENKYYTEYDIWEFSNGY